MFMYMLVGGHIKHRLVPLRRYGVMHFTDSFENGMKELTNGMEEKSCSDFG